MAIGIVTLGLAVAFLAVMGIGFWDYVKRQQGQALIRRVMSEEPMSDEGWASLGRTRFVKDGVTKTMGEDA